MFDYENTDRVENKKEMSARMWVERARGSAEAPSSSMSGIYDAIREAGIFGYEKNFEIF